VRPDVVDLTAHTGLVALPAELRACAGRVRALAVQSNRLEALPAWWGELSGLTELRVDCMQSLDSDDDDDVFYLQELPDALGQLTTLRTLELRGCTGMKALPQGLTSLTGLRQLDLSRCRGLTALPAGLGTLTGLRQLDLSDCSELTALPAGLGTLTGLERLNLSDCYELTTDQLTALPAELVALTGLRQLGLSDALGQLTTLRTLEVRGGTGLKARRKG
jgi:Leucine-rich repeat (LRR) protein